MSYLNENGLARYDGLIKNWVTFKSGTVDGIAPLLNWQRTETAASVTCYPLPAAPIDPVVNFMFTETGPSEGTKNPDNPSTITGVSSITVTRCETAGVDETQYTIDLGGTFYGGSVDLSTGTMTVTWAFVVFDGTEPVQKGGSAPNTYWFIPTYNPNIKQIDSFSSTHFDVASSLAGTGMISFTAASGTRFGWTISTSSLWETADDVKDFLANQYTNGTPLTVVYELKTPQTVQLTPTQIYSLSQADPYTPRLNTVYSDQTFVQVGYPKSPLATSTELTNAIISLGGNV